MKIWKKIALALLGLFILAQFITPGPPENTVDNPGDLIKNGVAEGEVAKVLRNSCYDCHSNEVNYPWYSYVSPVSLLVRHDVLEGKEELNFSEWVDSKKRRKLKKLKEVEEVIIEGEMPMQIYTFLHRDAVLSEAEMELLISWTKNVREEIRK